MLYSNDTRVTRRNNFIKANVEEEETMTKWIKLK